jgi:hypothetical protein
MHRVHVIDSHTGGGLGIAVEQDWLPVVSALNPKAVYDTADMAEGRLADYAMQALVRVSPGYRHRDVPMAEAVAALQQRLLQGREHHYKAWLQDLHYARQRLPSDRRLDPAELRRFYGLVGGQPFLVSELATGLHPNNLVRIIRALEVYQLTGIPLSSYQKEHAFATQRYGTQKTPA